jgi:ribosomal-protein-alanine N-acetyltransferase
MSAAILPAGAAHAALMAAIHAAACPASADGGGMWSEADFALQLSLPGCFGLLLGPHGLLLARVAAQEAEILTFAVVPEARRQGAGRALLRAAAAESAARGAADLFLEVAESNTPARALYAAEGFAPVGRRPGYYGPGHDALVLRRRLSPPPCAAPAA